MQDTEIVIRPMQPEEQSQVRELVRRAFAPTAQIFFSWSGPVLVAEKDGDLLGGIVLKVFPLPGGRKGGLVAWVFADPDARRLGVGRALVEGGVDYFNAAGCDEIFACVDGYNASSAKLFATRGFSILSPGEQFRRYGWQTLTVWWRAVYFANVGHFLWTRPPEATSDSAGLQWWGTWLLNLLFGWLAVWRLHGFRGFDATALLALPVALLLLLGARYLAMRGAAMAQGLQVRYRTWESTLPITLLLAVFFGGLFPTPGSLYPRVHHWQYRELLPKLGRMALAGTLAVLLLTWGAWGLREFAGLGSQMQDWLGYVLFAGMPLSLVDTLFVFFPFGSFNGRRVRDWNRVIWILLALAALGLLWI